MVSEKIGYKKEKEGTNIHLEIGDKQKSIFAKEEKKQPFYPLQEEVFKRERQVKKQKLKSIFSIRMFDEERCYENTSGLDVEELCRAYAACNRPFVEMESYGERIEIAEFAYLQQGEKLLFSVEFDADKDEIVLSDGEHFEHRGLIETLFGQLGEKEMKVTLTGIALRSQKEDEVGLKGTEVGRGGYEKGKKEYGERISLKERLVRKKEKMAGKEQEYKDHIKKKEQIEW